MARKFLYLVAFIIFAVLGVVIAFQLKTDWFMRTAFVPTEPFVAQAPVPANSYANLDMWIAHPKMEGKNDPAVWRPAPVTAAPAASATADHVPGVAAANAATVPAVPDAAAAATPPTPGSAADEASARGNASIFFVHPTSLITKDGWNASLDDQTTNERARIFVRGEASVFNMAGKIWAPRYRQAAIGAFLTDSEDATKAIDAAYQDVATAFDQFLSEVPDNSPIILAGHSQGSLHLLRLLKEKVAGRPIAKRIAAAYIVGWPISLDHDLPSMGLPACGTAEASNCIVSWSSYAEPADPGMVLDVYAKSLGLDGTPRGTSPMLCINPVNGTPNSSSTAAQNPGTLVPTADFLDGSIRPGAVPARCDERGILLIGDPPKMGPYVLPGNNYHVYDYPLFWIAAREDVLRRLTAFDGKAPPPPAKQRRNPVVPVAD